MNPLWEESEFIFCDLQATARFIGPRRSRRRAFFEAAYDSFEFVARNPGIGRKRADLGFPHVRSWRIEGFRRDLIFYRELPDRVQIWRVLHGARDLPRRLTD